MSVSSVRRGRFINKTSSAVKGIQREMDPVHILGVLVAGADRDH